MLSVERDNVWLNGRDRSIVGLNEASYPFLLSQIPDPPRRLYVEGQVGDWLRPAIAVVGSRKPTAAGEEFAFHLAHGLAEYGIVVVSGLALGIDSAAHKGAMAGGGLTIAVCGTGLDIVYPRQNRILADQIKTTGGLVSEFSIGTGKFSNSGGSVKGFFFSTKNSSLCFLFAPVNPSLKDWQLFKTNIITIK